MANVFVQFSDASKTEVVAVFGCRQSDVEYPNQDEIDGGDPRYLAFVDPISVKSVAIAHKWDAIKAKRDAIKAGGVKVGTKWYHSDDGSRIQQMGLVMMGASIPANLQWKTMDGSFITMTQTLVSQVVQAVAASDNAVFAAAEAHRVAMEASADPAFYDYSGGWPKIYGE